MATRSSTATGRKIAKKVPVRTAARKTALAEPTAVVPIVVTAGDSVTLIVEPPEQKLVRDSFTMPKPEYEVLAILKSRLLRIERPTKKGELIRAGIAALAAMSDVELRRAVERIPSLKTGRPKKAKGDSKGVRKSTV